MSRWSPISQMHVSTYTQVHTCTCYREKNHLSHGGICSLGWKPKAWACPCLPCLVLTHHRTRMEGSRTEQSRFRVNSVDDGKQRWDARGCRCFWAWQIRASGWASQWAVFSCLSPPSCCHRAWSAPGVFSCIHIHTCAHTDISREITRTIPRRKSTTWIQSASVHWCR